MMIELGPERLVRKGRTDHSCSRNGLLQSAWTEGNLVRMGSQRRPVCWKGMSSREARASWGWRGERGQRLQGLGYYQVLSPKWYMVPRILSLLGHPLVHLSAHLSTQHPLSHQNLPGHWLSMCRRYRDKSDYLICTFTFTELMPTPTRCSIFYYLYQAMRSVNTSLVLASKDNSSQTSSLTHPYSLVMLIWKCIFWSQEYLVLDWEWSDTTALGNPSGTTSDEATLYCPFCYMDRSSYVLGRVIGCSFLLPKTFLSL